MLAGHVGVALGLKRLAPRLNLGVLVAAALLPDLVLWVLVLRGLETVRIPDDYAIRHQLAFTFPWSHGLVACIIAAAVAGAVAMAMTRDAAVARIRAGVAVEAAVLSHWLLDALVHGPELPILGDDSPMLGLGLWDTLPVALAIEAAIALGGLWLYSRGSRTGRMKPIVATTLLILAMTVAGMTVAPTPPSTGTLAFNSLAAILVFPVAYGWLDRPAAQALDVPS